MKLKLKLLFLINFLFILISTNVYAQKKIGISKGKYNNLMQTNLLKISVGDSKDNVIEKMGGVQTYKVKTFSGADKFTAPHHVDSFSQEGVVIEVLWYVTEWQEYPYYTKEFTPIIFENQKVVGLGESFLTDYERQKKINVERRTY